jgi:hypothetical protein
MAPLKIFSEGDNHLLPYIEQPYYIFSKKAIYIGSWKYGIPSGCGIMYLECGDVIEGEFENAELHGQGRHIYNDGSYYEGIRRTLIKT